MNIVDRLKQEHIDILAALNELIRGPIDDAEKYSKAYLEVMSTIDAHERGEEQTIYAALSSDIDLRPIALQAMEEHRIIRGLFRDLADVEVTEEMWLPRLVVANNMVALHTQVEEGNVLPVVDQSFDDAKKDQMEKDFTKVRDQIIQELKR